MEVMDNGEGTSHNVQVTPSLFAKLNGFIPHTLILKVQYVD